MVAHIERHGPLRLDQFMDWCLTDSEGGYYATQQAFGVAGDFTTAPEVSQIFGEMIALWLLDRWQALGSPDEWNLIELGPGRLTLIKDITRVLGNFCAPTVHLIDVRDHAGYNCHRTLADLPNDRPFLIVGNEYLDALPIRQFQDGSERMVAAQDGALVWAWQPHLAATQQASEVSPRSLAEVDLIAARCNQQAGAALFLDYGSVPFAPPTFQAVRAHQPVDPLTCPGEADLTAHVDFLALKDRAACAVFGPIEQGRFLDGLGGEMRLNTLSQQHPARATELAAGYQRLRAPDQMGTLFKALCLQSPWLPSPPGFAATDFQQTQRPEKSTPRVMPTESKIDGL